MYNTFICISYAIKFDRGVIHVHVHVHVHTVVVRI